MPLFDTSSLVKSVRIESEYGPTIDLDPAEIQRAPPNPLWRRVKPKVTVYFAPDIGVNPFVMAPYGPPGPSKWPQVELVATVAGGILLALVGIGTISLLSKR